MFAGKLVVKFYIYKVLIGFLLFSMTFDRPIIFYAVGAAVCNFLIMCKLMYEYHSYNPYEITNKDSVVLIVGISSLEIIAIFLSDSIGFGMRVTLLVKFGLVPVLIFTNFILLAIAYSLSKRVFRSKPEIDSTYDS